MNQCRHTQNEKGKKWHSRFTRWFFFRFNFLFCFCFVRFFSMGEYARWLETARRWLNQCSIIDPLSLSLYLPHTDFFKSLRMCSCSFMFSAVAEVTSVRAIERNEMACAPHRFAASTHMRFTTWSWFSQLPFECARHTGFLFFFGLQFAHAVCHSRDFYYTKSAHIIESIKIRHLLSTFALFFYFLLFSRRIPLERRVQ